MMNSGRFIFDSPHQGSSNMILLGNRNPTIFQGGRLLNMDGGANRRRPFFTLPEEMLEEEYYDEQQPEKKRRLTLQQVDMLERSFETENKLEPDRKSELALKLGLQPRQVAVWFQNRRARWKTKQLESDFDRLKASYEALAADHDELLKDNDRLRSQVISLTEKLQSKETAEAGGEALKLGNSAVAEETALHGQQKAEDRLSAGSAVVDEEGLVDRCGNSYLQESYQGGCAMGIQSEEDDGCSYLPGDMFTDSNNNEGWWVWN